MLLPLGRLCGARLRWLRLGASGGGTTGGDSGGMLGGGTLSSGTLGGGELGGGELGEGERGGSLWAAWAAAFAAAAPGLSMPKWSQIALTLSSFFACFTLLAFLPILTSIASIVAIGASFTSCPHRNMARTWDVM